ncbi:hypothetical protein EDS67_12420 [candidate division KSB1 bacterium]|nr:MAG: hypothetical protein EDS67_12420 [candidate division KSB1 bacterium]MCE7944751.1 hypothetical protein [Chlorobi bacterium CHB1]MDL1876736.1 hypothetical protein [Cytophagia bacterium CHB2]MBC6951185.1 hypothetical protein [candidate division KSB1 bacterium]NUM74063.1 hypothetical protein [candidate division KSB1 bacterium]
MKRTGWIIIFVMILLFIVAGAYSKQEERAKQRQQDEIEQIGKELDRLTLRAQKMAARLEQAKIRLAQ